jgi:hypothetical protein
MIRINSERGPVHLESWQNVRELPGYTPEIDPQSETLKEIIGAYSLGDPVSCGLSSCRTAHKRGYVVVTANGLVSNIGNICGVRHFGVDFRQKTRLYWRLARDYENRQLIYQTQSRIDELSSTIEYLINGDRAGKWLSRQRRLNGLPSRIRSQLREMARTGRNSVSVTREATKAERDDIEARTGQSVPAPYYIEQEIGVLKGVSALADANDPRLLITIKLKGLLDRLRSVNPEEMRSSELRDFSKECGEVDSRLADATRVIKIGQRFFSAGNLHILLRLSEGPAETKEIKRYLKQLGPD